MALAVNKRFYSDPSKSYKAPIPSGNTSGTNRGSHYIVLIAKYLTIVLKGDSSYMATLLTGSLILRRNLLLPLLLNQHFLLLNVQQ